MNDQGTRDPTGRAGASGGPGAQPPRPRVSGRTWLIIWIGVLLFNALIYGPLLTGSRTAQNGQQASIPYSTLVSQVERNNVTTAQISSDTASGAFKAPYKAADGHSYTGYTTTLPPLPDPGLLPMLQSHHVQVTGVSSTPPGWITAAGFLVSIVPLLFLIGLVYVISRGLRGRQAQGLFGMGQSKAKLYTEERPRTTFADVAGVDAAKRELTEEVDFLRDPQKYQRLGAHIPKGVLLVGPPGTGKTLLARAVAGEARVPFFSISATEFVEMFVGVGASRMRDLFAKAKAAAPCIVFIDEIDTIGRQRGGAGPLGGGGNDEREQTLNQLLVSMDGFELNAAVIILAATNRPDVLDQALLRPGRFDRAVTVEPPDRRGREAILRIHTRDIPLAPSVNLGALAQATPGMSGADLANVANEAALTAARKGATTVAPLDFEEALDRVTLGAEGAALMDAEERRTVAYHEGGHALVASLLPQVDPVHRVTITPRGRSLGVTQFRPLDDRRNYRRDYLLARMAVALGGRAAEEVVCGEITSGAQNDLQQVMRLARAMVTELGMADELGPAYFGGEGDDALGGRVSPHNPWMPHEYSEETGRRIDAAVLRLIAEAHQRARAVLIAHRRTLDAIAAALMAEESLDHAALTTLIAAQRPAPPDPVGPVASPRRDSAAPASNGHRRAAEGAVVRAP